MKCVKYMNIVITIISITASSACASEFRKFSITKGRIELQLGKSFFASRWVRSGYECDAWCYQQNIRVCSFAVFNSISGDCELFFWKDVKSVHLLLATDGPVADVYEYEMFIGPDTKHMYLSSTLIYFAFTFVEGQKHCEKIGGRLANQDDLHASRDNGWEICACGWLNDGAAFYSVSQESEQCSQTDWECSSGKYGVHCIIE